MRIGSIGAALSPRVLLARWLPRVKRLRRDQNGAVALEFGLIALPFFGIIFAILETCLVFLTGQALETAVTDASRLIFTGQAQTASFDAAKFKTEVCKRLTTLVNCSSDVYIDVRSFDSFTAASIPQPTLNGDLVTNNLQFSPGTAGKIVVVRAFLAYKIYTTILSPNLANLSGNKRLIMATASFRNEPYN